ncbi:hypothetical protein [Nocardioides sp.]|uniref:hypothetical protein n=1 Tax=Nocardioides sp. TaxID=35761 RepID=UPI002B27385A|nr:hypothetical protein [Nocardioides sp.]
MAAAPHGLVFPIDPTDAEGRRSTTSTGRGVVADALCPVDPVGSRAAERETTWRTQYLPWFRRLVEAGLGTPEDAGTVARAGLDSLHARMCVAGQDGEPDQPLTSWPRSTAGFGQVELHGSAEPLRELVLPYRGERLRGDDVRRRVEAWAQAGVVEPSLAEAIDLVLDNPDWLRLEGRTVAVIGAGSEMGPLQALSRWGARVAAVDLPRDDIWERVSDTVAVGAGTVVAPALEGRPGADLLADVPTLADWLGEQPGTLVLGNYVYADGATNVRVSMAVDELSRRLLETRDDTALAFLATPTDVFAVPGEAVDQALAAYAGRGRFSKGFGRPLRTVSGGRLLQRPYAGPADPGINDSLVPQQGPNYALAKRLQRWRATNARHDGRLVSLNVAPPTRTRSVVKNRALAAAYAGAHRFGVEVFDPSTSNVLMAALLVHDLHTGGGPHHEHSWQDEAYAAAHGGLWRAAYSPRSALGLAALLGVGGARG